MTDQTNESQQPNGGAERKDTPEELRIKAEHRQALAKIESEDRRALSEMFRTMPITLRVMFDPILSERVKVTAEVMSRAEGFTPRHLLGKVEACFVVVSKALMWRLDPQAVASATYQTPDGKVGYEGKLVQAIIEGSGKLEKPIGQGEYFGDWSKVEGKFRIIKRTAGSGKEYDAPVPQWEYFGPDEEGLGVRYQIYLKDQNEPLKFEFKLRSAYPRNAMTWPTRPQQQLHYAAMRALGNVVCPSLIMGVPFQDDLGPEERGMKDVTPAPPPVDLKVEGIVGRGHMTEADEARQGRASEASKAQSTENSKPAEIKEEPFWKIEGKPYRQAGRVQNILIGKITACGSLEDLEQFEGDVLSALSLETLPDTNRQAIEGALEHQRSVLEAQSERSHIPTTNPGRPAEVDNEGPLKNPDLWGPDYPTSELDHVEDERFRQAEQRNGARKEGKFNLLKE
jgi:hypothetical protein